MYPAHWFEVIDNLIPKDDIETLVGETKFRDSYLWANLQSCQKTVIVTDDDDLGEVLAARFAVTGKCRRLDALEVFKLKGDCGASTMDVSGDLDLWRHFRA